MTDENKQTDQGMDVPAEAQAEADKGVKHARKAADEFKSAASAVADDYRGRAEDAWNDARYKVQSFQEDSEQYVRDNPTKAIFSALGIGFVLGLIFRR